eukprot:gb/GECG01003657.1/.p1 GENE.gb/GECG01003657.1/~~gb/GECG01003657.1/.p1  ORF type:complete len:437 (+),score=31.11 gb/GECG01003657.1/:1-1311(+)
MMASISYAAPELLSLSPSGFSINFPHNGMNVLSSRSAIGALSKLTSFTLSMWIRPTPSLHRRYMCLFTKGTLEEPEYALCLSKRINLKDPSLSSESWRVTLTLGATTESQIADASNVTYLNAAWSKIWHSEATVNVEQWNRLDISWNGTHSVIAINNSGVEQADMALAQTGGMSEAPLIVGGFSPFRSLESFTYSNTFEGDMDELLFWRYSLELGKTPLTRLDPGLPLQEKMLLGYWSFNDGRGFTALNEVKDPARSFALHFSAITNVDKPIQWQVSTVPLHAQVRVTSEKPVPVRVFAAERYHAQLTGHFTSFPKGITIFKSTESIEGIATVDWSRKLTGLDNEFPVFRPEAALDYYSTLLTGHFLRDTVSFWLLADVTETVRHLALEYSINGMKAELEIKIEVSPPNIAPQVPRRIPILYRGINLTDVDAEEDL